MSFVAFCTFADKPGRIVFKSRNLETAFAYALNIADELGLLKRHEISERLITIDIYERDDLVISISVIDGGLVPLKDNVGLRSK